MESLDPEQLLRTHMGWLRQLAGDLCRDPHDAEDLAQTAALAVLRHPPTNPGSIRSWLRTILHNQWLNELRHRRRRRTWEEQAARPEATPDAVDVLERGRQARMLLDAVCALDEPWRRTLMMRYLDELPPRRIARTLGVPVATVHSRLHRGLHKLRQALDEREGSRRAWMAVLATLAPRTPHPALHFGIAAAAMLAATAGLAVVLFGSGSQVGTQPLPVARAASLDAHAAPASPTAASGTRRNSVPAIPAPTPDADSSREVLRGWVIDATGRPRGGVPVVFSEDEGTPASSDAAGHFALPLPQAEGRLTAAEPGLTTVYAGHYRPGSLQQPVVVVADAALLRGRVVGPHGSPVVGATVRVEPDPEFESASRHSLEASQPLEWRADTDAEGWFSIPDAPATQRARVRIAAPSYRTATMRWLGDSQPLHAVLQPADLAARDLQGRVVDAAGRAVAGASITLGPRAATISGSDGTFCLAHPPGASTELLAVATGYLPSRTAVSSAAASPLTIVLSGKPSHLSGQVLRSSGQPIAGARVWLANPELLGVVGDRLQCIENVLAGAPTSEEHRRVLLGAGPRTDLATYFNEAMDEFHAFVATDAEGRFTLPGLLPKPYELAVMETSTLRRHAFGPFEAGRRDLTLRMPAPDLIPLHGIARDRDGRLLANILVTTRTEVARAVVAGESAATMSEAHTEEGPDGPVTTYRRMVSGQTCVTDDLGRFHFEATPRQGIQLRFQGDTILDQTRTVRGPAPETDVILERRHPFRVDVAGANPQPNSFALLDETGSPLPVFEIRGGQASWSDHTVIDAARTPTFSVSERAREIVLYRDAHAVGRAPVVLGGAEISVLSWAQ